MWKVTAALVAGLFGLVLLGSSLNIFGEGIYLAWLPWRTHFETKIVRNSNGYITAQQEMLRSLRADFDGAAIEQKAGIRRQMSEIADLIPNDVQPDIATFLGR